MKRTASNNRPGTATNFLFSKNQLIKTLNMNSGVEDVFQLLDPRIDCRDKAEFDLSNKTKQGDTLLHCIVHDTVKHPEDTELHMKLVDRITAKSAEWWCTMKGFPYPDDDDLLYKYKHDAMRYLLSNIMDDNKRSVWMLTFKVVSVTMIRKLMYLEGVYCFSSEDCKHFDVSNLSKYLNFSLQNFLESACGLYCYMHRREPGLEELLQRAKLKHKVADVLGIKPIKKIAEMYGSFTAKIYLFIVFLHVLYMSVMSYVGCELMDSTKPQHSDTTKGLIYSIGLTEPILLSFYLFNEFCKFLGIMCCFEDESDSLLYLKRVAPRFVTVLVYTVLLCEVIASVDQVIWSRERYILSLCLLLGWLLTFALADGIKPIHFFFKLVVTIMATDVLKIFLVYIIFLTGFSVSLHAQFISTANITNTFKTPIHTMYMMFNVMMGMEEAVSESTEGYLEEVSASPVFSKLLYIGYVLCSSIVLLNLLIAMMNTSYSRIRDQHSYEWICDAAHFGMKTSQYFPVFARRLGVKYVKYGTMFPRSKIKDVVWYITEVETGEEEDDPESLTPTDLDLRKVRTEIKHSENRLKSQITEIRKSQHEMMECIQDLRKQIIKLTSSRP